MDTRRLPLLAALALLAAACVPPAAAQEDAAAPPAREGLVRANLHAVRSELQVNRATQRLRSIPASQRRQLQAREAELVREIARIQQELNAY